jgi:hypothetical protein
MICPSYEGVDPITRLSAGVHADVTIRGFR